MPKPEKPVRSIAMTAFCHQCLGYYQDGKIDCEATKCPLYSWMPYRKKDPDLVWLDYNPKHKGLVTWEESEREMSDEDRAAVSERMKKMHERGEL
jgi:hypothetical protein